MLWRHFSLFVSAVLLAGGVGLTGQELYLRAKGELAGILIRRAFAAHLTDGAEHRPWGWADMHPVAALEVPRLGLRRIVISGATGNSLAFGPGHVDGTAAPNQAGNAAIAGHRDGWFAFLEHLRPGDEIHLTTREGTQRYRVAKLAVRSMWDLRDIEPTAHRQLTLVTCYPFDGLLPSQQRYVVTSLPI